MLNTDLHSPQVRKRMDITAYSRNLRGVNDGTDFAPEYLVSLAHRPSKRLAEHLDSTAIHLRLDSETRDCLARGAAESSRIRVRLEGVASTISSER